MEAAGRSWKVYLMYSCLIVLASLLYMYWLDKNGFIIFWESRHKCSFEIPERVQKWKNLEKSLKMEIFGQHIAVDTSMRAIYAHITDTSPSKALVLCFHGSLGSGKTHLSQLIAKHLYDGGFDSPFVHSFIGPRHFLRDPAKIQENQDHLRQRIELAAKNCGRALFVFDEVDKMAPEIFNTLVPFIDHHDSIDGVDYRGLIFIFLSNTGGNIINDLVLQRIESGKSRESITVDDFKQIIAQNAFAERGGLFHAEMIGKRLVDYYIPFLPLERVHVTMCARRDIIKRQVLFVQPEKVAAKTIYWPKSNPVFSEDGCKSVTTNVNFYMRETDSVFNET